MKKFRSMMVLLLTISLVLSLTSTIVSAEPLSTEPSADTQNSSSAAVISNALKEQLHTAGKSELIPVTIRLKDCIDLGAVEQQAIGRADLSAEEKAILCTDTSKMSEKNQNYQLAALKVRDKIYSERNAILKEYYAKKNSDFVAKYGLSEVKIGSVGIFTSFIREVLLTKDQIKSLETNPDVCYLDYACSREGVDFAAINETYQIINGDVCVNSGYTGSGIKVGLVEKRHPILS